ncbi:hypothetical protein FJ364_05435 [Candidatus Dependentiae bacterium]|nr:hypothetical protein [Candidatus Dependentiae bacterium]
MIIELVFLATTVFFTTPFLYAETVGSLLSIKQPAVYIDVKTNNDEYTARGAEKTVALVKHKHVLVVFIHGTLFPIPSLSSMQKWAGDRFKGSARSLSYSELLREKSIFRHQPIGSMGLNPVVPDWSGRANGAELMSFFFQEMYKLLPQEEWRTIHPYTFGWDGSLSLIRRKNQARFLLQGLQEAFTTLQQQCPQEGVEIIVIAHSHGGNLALHMADWSKESESFAIDHVFMFGTPIHGDTQHLAAASLFKHVYNIHSEGDFIQIADVVSTSKYMLGRVFADEKVLSSPSVKQIAVEIDNYKPNHSELWFFRRASVFFFRAGLPIAPLPVAAFTPLLLHQIKKTKQSEHFLKWILNKDSSNLSVNLVPYQDYWQNSLAKFHQYENRFDFSRILNKLPLILNE